MTRIGDQSAPAVAGSRIGNIAQQVAQKETMPERGVITELGAWLRGITGYGSIAYRLCVWSWDGDESNNNALLAQTAEHSIGAAAYDLGSLTKVTWSLGTPLELDAGDVFLVGISTDTASGSACQFGLRGSGLHWRRDRAGGTAWPISMHDSYSDSRDGAFWVENYDALGAAWVRRSGAWVRADAVQTRRSGVWVQADTVAVRRSGVWVDAD